MNELDKIVRIKNKIYEIRGIEVMLDSDLAELYQCANGTKTINQAVKRNMERFPSDFYFQLTENEIDYVSRSQTGTLKIEQGHNVKYLPYAFTEQGIAMLATVLKTEVAAEMSIKIMDAFVALKHYISDNLIEQKFVNKQVLKNTEDIKLLKESFQKFEEKKKINEIYFNGQIYDAYSKILDIFKSAKKKLIIIDSYADNTLLDIIKRLNIDVVIITKKDNLLTWQDIIKYNKQYYNLKVLYNNDFHDRYFLIDENIVYHCGASINRIGYKTFSITMIGDKEICKLLFNKVNNIINFIKRYYN